mgnify:FL=1
MWLRAERLSETAIAFARAGRASDETAIAFARAGSAPTETDIAFAGEKWAFWVRFLVAEVMVVSMVAVWGRALVMAVSCWPASAVAVVSLVSTSPPHSCLCAKKFALLGPARTRARKSSPSARKMAHNRRFMACWASFFAKTPLEGSRRAKFFAEQPRNRACWPSSVAPPLRHACCWAAFVSGRIGKRPAGNATDGWA